MRADVDMGEMTELRPSGLVALRELAWGTHLSQLYWTKEDLSEVLVPFFEAGLRANERCMWVTSQPLNAVGAREALREAVPDVDERIAAGQLEIIDYDDWYLRCGGLDSDQVLRGWLDREGAARARGFAGLRITGNTFWLDAADWQSFAEYEAKVHRAFRGRRILALCSYSLAKCGPDEIMDVLRHHGFALMRGERGWEVVQSAAVALTAATGRQAPDSDEASAAPPEPRTHAAAGAHACHAVRFFEDERYPAGRIAEHLQQGLAAGDGALVFAAPGHGEQIVAALAGLGVDVEDALARQRLALVDAQQVARDLGDGPAADKPAFLRSVAAVVRESVRQSGRVYAYGEIVDVLARGGQPAKALELEDWWNELLLDGRVELLCGYSLATFACAGASEPFQKVCAAHHAVEAIDGRPADENGRLLAELQQTRAALAVEARERRAAERARDRLVDGELAARQRAQAATEQLARLQRVTAALSEVKSLPAIASVVAREISRTLGAAEAALAVADPQGRRLRVLVDDGGRGSPDLEEGSQPGDWLDVDAQLPVAIVYRSGFPLYLSDPAAIARYPEAMRAAPHARSIACLPVVLASEQLGALQVIFTDPHDQGPAERAVLEDFARQIAVALGRAHSYQRVQLERARAEQEQRRAEAASRAKDEFVAVLSHELRNPLSPILTAVQLMRLRGGDVLVKERAMIERQINHMVRLVDDLMDVSRIARGKVDLKREPMQLAAAVADALEVATPLLEQRAHELVTEVPASGLWVAADPVRLRQIIVNLLTNAAKYTPVRGRVRLTVEVREGRVALQVRDSGVGIDAALLPRVFDLFAQGAQASDRALGGLGLGLSIARNLAEMHGGSLSGHSAGAGRGSTFTLELPLLDEVVASTRPREGAFPALVERGGLRVLVVDDNVDAALALAEALEALGHAPGVAHDGPAALRVAADLRPQLALLDIGLPAMDGYELAARLANQLGPECPTLVAISGYGEERDRQRSRDAGFVEHLTKPTDLQRITAVIQQLMPDEPLGEVGVGS